MQDEAHAPCRWCRGRPTAVFLGRIPPMRRPRREFRAESFELEGRLLLATGTASTPAGFLPLQFEGTTISSGFGPTQVVTQRAGKAIVTLLRSNTAGNLQVQVMTDPNSPFVGVNVGAVNQMVTFANGQARATVTVPIRSGAPNPGKVDVYLN